MIGPYFRGECNEIESWAIETSNDNQTWDAIDER